MNNIQISQILEVGLMCSKGPCSVAKLISLFKPEDEVNKANLEEALKDLQERWQCRGLELHKSASGWHFRTITEHKDRLKVFLEATPPRLSRPLTEVLSIVAYNQPATRGDIETIRGVTTSVNQLSYLEELGWVEVSGKRETPGRPLEYATTSKFLDDLGLQNIKELPDLEQFLEEITEDSNNSNSESNNTAT